MLLLVLKLMLLLSFGVIVVAAVVGAVVAVVVVVVAVSVPLCVVVLVMLPRPEYINNNICSNSTTRTRCVSIVVIAGVNFTIAYFHSFHFHPVVVVVDQLHALADITLDDRVPTFFLGHSRHSVFGVRRSVKWAFRDHVM